MRKLYILSPLPLALGAVLWMSASGGVAKIQQKDRTNSPVSSPACTMCHLAGANFSTSASIVVSDGTGPITEYIPGETYTVKVDIQSTGNSGHGFQITGLLANNSSAGSCTVVTSGTQKTSLGGRWYFEQSQTVTGGSYEMTWVAPAAGSGEVTFYGSALSTNGDGLTNGDEYVSISPVKLPEGTPNSVFHVNVTEGLELYPNPTVSEVIIRSSSEEMQEVQIYALNGTLMEQRAVNTDNVRFNVEDYVKGTYIVKVSSGQDVQYLRFVKN
ncbi:T9SS type A sorting domain-containing protein [bacterium SCSIO 12643]|nr:T9SS type A sorting domain-containing protein [bacterium SCSIO 12643]